MYIYVSVANAKGREVQTYDFLLERSLRIYSRLDRVSSVVDGYRASR